MTSLKQYKLTDLIKDLDVNIQGDPDCLITGISPIHTAEKGHITFLTNPLYKKYINTTQASAIILSKENEEQTPATVIFSQNPHYHYAKIAAFFAEVPDQRHGIHPTAVIGSDCDIHASVHIGAHSVIGNQVKIGANTNIDAGVTIGDNAEIGCDSKIDSNATIYHKVKIAHRTRIASGVVIGSEGFGFAAHDGRWHKVPQLGSVVIGDDVDIGANTTIDRGAIGDTIIEEGAKLDNLIQIGHNVRIGANTIMAGCTGVAGSTTIGKNCMIGGASCINGHISICDGVMITGMTAVTKSITERGIYSSGIVGAVPNHEFRKNNARFHRLENLMQKVKQLESEVKDLKAQKTNS